VITVELVGDKELVARLDAMPGRVRDGLVRAVARLGLELQKKVQDEKLSGQVLHQRSGALARSIDTQVSQTETAVSASVGTAVRYARFHEYGVAHPWLIQARTARALRFLVGGRVIFRRYVRHPPLPERSFLRSALKEMRPEIEEGLRAAVAEAIRK
jgi:HK97 gp10 family phage protein